MTEEERRHFDKCADDFYRVVMGVYQWWCWRYEHLIKESPELKKLVDEGWHGLQKAERDMGHL